MKSKLKRNAAWLRDPANPVLPPVPGSPYDSDCCMNPWAVKRGEEVDLYYAGADANNNRRICLATARLDDATAWERKGVVLDIGAPGSFDANWCVLPHVIRLENEPDRLYYTANSGVGSGLDAFPGIGVAFSEDGDTWLKREGEPLVRRTQIAGDPDCQGIAGGSVLRTRMADGGLEWRFYYTACPTLGDDVFLDQQKIICLAVSEDGISWTKRGAVLKRDPQVDYENIAVAGPVVQQLEDGSFRMWYSAIGTRWGFYSICYAESEDGVVWNRGTHYGDNLQLGPKATAWSRANWESMMVEYPSVVTLENGGLRLFYTGNNYGEGGIGTALAAPIRATRLDDGVHLALTDSGGEARLVTPVSANAVDSDGVPVATALPAGDPLSWQGPDADGTLWYEAVGAQLAFRVAVVHLADGLELRATIMNVGDKAIRDARLPFAFAQPGGEGAADGSGVSFAAMAWAGADKLLLAGAVYEGVIVPGSLVCLTARLGTDVFR